MGKYSSRARERSGPNPKTTVNPYMRGIGCLMMVIVPVFSYLAGKELAASPQLRSWGIFPPDWFNPLILSPALAQLFKEPIYPATLVIAVFLTIAVGGFISIVYGYAYNLLAPSKYGPTDVPPPRVKTKKYKR